MAPVLKPLQERLLSKIKSTKPNECWEWMAGKDKDGYGTIQGRKDGTWQKLRAHRVSYELFRGEIPDRFFVCHSCDNPACINPAHFFLGVALDNNRDAQAKGRHRESRKTHCLRGHELAGDNLYLPPGRNERVCRECKRIRSINFHSKNRTERTSI